MAELAYARKGMLVQKLLELLFEHPEGLGAYTAIATLKPRVNPTPYELENVPSGVTRFDVNLRWLSTDLKRAGWLTKHQGKWSATETGRAAIRDYSDPERFYREMMRLGQSESNANSASTNEIVVSKPDPEELNREITYEQAEERSWTEIESYLRSIPPYDFQDLVGDLLKAMGYHVSWISPPGKDGGIDILAWTDPLGSRPPRIKVQVKRYSQNIPVDGLRSFMALLGDDDVGLFVTTSGFTKDAQDEARTQEKRKITLIDLERFVELWVEYYGKLSDGARRKFPLQPIYFLAPRD